MNKIFNILLSFIFTNTANAQNDLPAPPMIMYGPPERSIYEYETLLSVIYSFGATILILMIVPIVGLIWYRKKQIKKRWPVVVIWILIGLFILAIGGYILIQTLSIIHQ